MAAGTALICCSTSYLWPSWLSRHGRSILKVELLLRISRWGVVAQSLCDIKRRSADVSRALARTTSSGAQHAGVATCDSGAVHELPTRSRSVCLRTHMCT